MGDEQTCGKGLAEHSALPAKLAELIGSVADNLEIHMKALDLSDANAMKERDAYESLTRQHRQIASLLRATAAEMAGYRDLPMGRHDETAMSSPQLIDAFEALVSTRRETVELLQAMLKQEETMLAHARA
jgi:transposase